MHSLCGSRKQNNLEKRGDMETKKDKLFIGALSILILLFLYGFITNINGDQGAVFCGRAGDYMADYYNVAEYAATRNPYGYGRETEYVDALQRMYPPLAYVIAYYQSKAADYINFQGPEAGRTNLGLATSAFFMFFCAAWFMLLIYSSIRKSGLYKALILLCMMLSGIFIFSYERGNNIFLAALCSSFFVLNYNSENKALAELSYVALAIAAGLKVYPALLGILLIFDKNYKGAFRLILYGIAFGFLPFFFLEGGLRNIPILFKNLQKASELFEDLVFPRFNFRFWASQIENAELKALVYAVVKKLSALCCIAAVAASYFQTQQWKRIMLILLALVIFPVNSAEYTGLYLFVGIILFLNEKQWSLLDAFYMVFIVLILNPFQVIVHECNYTTWAMNLSASAMLILLLADTVYQMIKLRGHVKYGR